MFPALFSVMLIWPQRLTRLYQGSVRAAACDQVQASVVAATAAVPSIMNSRLLVCIPVSFALIAICRRRYAVCSIAAVIPGQTRPGPISARLPRFRSAPRNVPVQRGQGVERPDYWALRTRIFAAQSLSVVSPEP